jgi:uncharacterized heparinase superfamily protein
MYGLESVESEMPRSAAYDDAGMYVLRDQRFHVVIKASNLGLYGMSGPHNHNDVLSFDLAADGLALIVDPGTGQYTGSISERNRFRSTASHNTVMVDDVEQNSIGSEDDLGSVWSLGSEAQARVLHCCLGNLRDRLIAEHRGYERLVNPIVHRREFVMDHERSVFSLRDTFHGETTAESHRLQWNFVLHPDVEIVHREDQIVELHRDGRVAIFESPLAISVCPGVYSPSYKRTVDTKRLQCRSLDASRTYEFRIWLLKNDADVGFI